MLFYVFQNMKQFLDKITAITIFEELQKIKQDV